MVDGVAAGGTGLAGGSVGKGDASGDDFNIAVDQAKSENEGASLDEHGGKDTCTVEVRFNRVMGNTYHGHVVTTEPNGQQDSYRGGPKSDTWLGGSGASATQSGGASNTTTHPNGNPEEAVNGWGNIKTYGGEYDELHPDWNPEEAPSVTVAETPGDCSEHDKNLAKAAKDIGDANIPYDPTHTNSNSAAREMLERSGLDQPEPPVWAPAWHTQLPD